MTRVFVILVKNTNSVMVKSKDPVKIHAVLGVVWDDKQILVSQRQSHQSYSGYWELPGGKVELDESAIGALKRELLEELNIKVLEYHMLGSLINHFPERTVHIEIFGIKSYDGKPRGNEGQNIQWVHIDQVLKLDPLLPGSPEVIKLIKNKQ